MCRWLAGYLTVSTGTSRAALRCVPRHLTRWHLVLWPPTSPGRPRFVDIRAVEHRDTHLSQCGNATVKRRGHEYPADGLIELNGRIAETSKPSRTVPGGPPSTRVVDGHRVVPQIRMRSFASPAWRGHQRVRVVQSLLIRRHCPESGHWTGQFINCSTSLNVGAVGVVRELDVTDVGGLGLRRSRLVHGSGPRLPVGRSDPGPARHTCESDHRVAHRGRDMRWKIVHCGCHTRPTSKRPLASAAALPHA